MESDVQELDNALGRLGIVTLAKRWATLPTALLLGYQRRLRELLAEVDGALAGRRDVVHRQAPATGPLAVAHGAQHPQSRLLPDGRAGRIAALIDAAPEMIWTARRVRESAPGLGSMRVLGVALCDLAHRGYIRRVGRGLYRARDDRVRRGAA